MLAMLTWYGIHHNVACERRLGFRYRLPGVGLLMRVTHAPGLFSMWVPWMRLYESVNWALPLHRLVSSDLLRRKEKTQICVNWVSANVIMFRVA